MSWLLTFDLWLITFCTSVIKKDEVIKAEFTILIIVWFIFQLQMCFREEGSQNVYIFPIAKLCQEWTRLKFSIAHIFLRIYKVLNVLSMHTFNWYTLEHQGPSLKFIFHILILHLWKIRYQNLHQCTLVKVIVCFYAHAQCLMI